MWIEVLGLPGVGKTTAISRLLAEGSIKANVIRSDNPSLSQRIYAKFLYLFLYRRLCRINSLALKLAYRHSLRLFLSRNDNVFFFDSGLIQVLIEYIIAEDEPDFDMIERIIYKIKFTDRVILLTDKLENIVKRECLRSPRRYSFAEDDLTNRYKKALTYIEEMLISRLESSVVIEISINDNKQLNIALGSN